MTAVPLVMPKTLPDVSTVATDKLDDDQKPPVELGVSTENEPRQILGIPLSVMVGGAKVIFLIR
jgi:hypothetical protein